MATQIELATAGQMERRPSGPMELLHIAIQNNSAIDVIERLAALQEKAMARDAEMAFNLAMNAAQSEIVRVAPDLTNPETHSKYASYPQLDRVVRPVYIRNGFSLSFDTADCPFPEHVRAVCYVSHRDGHTRRYQADVPADGKGPKGGAVMTKTHATGAAMSYGARYLLKYIFNIAVGEDDTDGNAPGGKPAQAMNAQEFEERLSFFPKCSTLQELQDHFVASFKEARKFDDERAKDAFYKAKEARKAKLKEVAK